ncbi:DUF6485 family protein [Desulfuromonas carbonis]|uniref:DUF6485 family protein n=1 Tax=Desulfuromonas sp. DDH964 TaxID=1823759 RepID=UPI00083124D6|nr:DUF6485 family protein [Desulfuromonas sp. DDH964]
MECTAKSSPTHCSCSYPGCDKHGNCCQCVLFHRQRNEIPGCFFSAAGERSYDRSLNHFLKDRCR